MASNTPTITKFPGGLRWEGVYEGRFHYVHAHPPGRVAAFAYCRTCNSHSCGACEQALLALGYTLGDTDKHGPSATPPKPGSPGTVAGPAAPTVSAPKPSASRTRRTPKPRMEDSPSLELTAPATPDAPAPVVAPTPTPSPEAAGSGSFLDFIDTLGSALVPRPATAPRKSR